METSKTDNRFLHMKYPAPLSQSWAGMGYPRRSFILDKAATKAISGIDNTPKKYASGNQVPYNIGPTARFTGQDPTAPHLKYGLFPKKMSISRGQSRILTIKPSSRTPLAETRPGSPRRPRCIVEPSELKIERPAIARVSTVQKFLQNPPAEEGELSRGPMFVFRPLEHRNLRSLTVSASTHLDIKPKRSTA